MPRGGAWGAVAGLPLSSDGHWKALGVVLRVKLDRGGGSDLVWPSGRT